MILVFYFLFLNLSLAVDNLVGCSSDPVIQSPPYILQCSPGSDPCACNPLVTNTGLNYFMSKPLPERPVVRCTPNPPAIVQNVNLLNETINPNALNSTEIFDPNCPAGTVSSTLGEFVDTQTYRFQPSCGYNLRLRSRPINSFLAGVMSAGPESICAPSLCTTASYSVFLLSLRELERQGKLPATINMTEMTSTRSTGWQHFSSLARPDMAVFELGIGSGRTINAADIDSCASRNWPTTGDFVQIWRGDNSGHSVIFSNYLKNSAGELIGICYWSSNQATNGFRHRCEPIGPLTKIIAGRITL